MGILKKWTCSIKDYPTEIKVSDAQRARYWEKGDELPKKYSDTSKYDWNTDGVLEDLSTSEKVIKNIKSVGKPRMLTINAQRIYVGIHHSVRSRIVNELHEIFNKEFKAQLPAKIKLDGTNKILIGLHFHDTYTPKLPDLDNLANLFVKCGIDCLTTVNNPNQMKGLSITHKLGILPDDKMIFIPHIMYEFTHVDKKEDRKLDFNIYLVKDDFTIESLLDKELKAQKKQKIHETAE